MIELYVTVRRSTMKCTRHFKCWSSLTKSSEDVIGSTIADPKKLVPPVQPPQAPQRSRPQQHQQHQQQQRQSSQPQPQLAPLHVNKWKSFGTATDQMRFQSIYRQLGEIFNWCFKLIGLRWNQPFELHRPCRPPQLHRPQIVAETATGRKHHRWCSPFLPFRHAEGDGYRREWRTTFNLIMINTVH